MAALVSEYTLEFFTLLNARGKKELIEWCMKEGLIASSYECPKCNEQMGLNERKSVVLDGFEWRCRKKGVNTHDIIDELNSVYGDSAPSFTTVKILAIEFKRGRKSLGDVEHSGRPNTATTDENIAKVHQMELNDRQIKVRDISEAMNMSKERVCHILNQHLDMRKLSTHCVLRLLTLDQKRFRMSISNALLAQFRRNKSEFWHRLIIVDEAWIHHYSPKTKIEFKQRTAKGAPAPKKAKTVSFGLGK
ncbi:histone-lysine N-methyltransferase SETMAR [Trichonephila clavipes]|nr:histone-lysine N-methyltransferase SETMAR [Trichonephila clavipes]